MCRAREAAERGKERKEKREGGIGGRGRDERREAVGVGGGKSAGRQEGRERRRGEIMQRTCYRPPGLV